jgi:hypothetical protein
MKKAVIFFKGKVICFVEFEELINHNGLSFNIKEEEVAFFNEEYSFCLEDNNKFVVDLI